MKKSSVQTIIACFVVLIAVLSTSSCGNTSPILVNATGGPGEIMLVMDKQYLESPLGVAVEQMLTQPERALTQPEDMMNVSRTTIDNFSGFLTYVRNVMIIEIDKDRFSKTAVKYDYDRWAKGQLVIKMTAPAADSISSYIKTNNEELMNIILRHELFRFADYLDGEWSIVADSKVDSLFGWKINVPRDIRRSKVGKDFLWMSNDAFSKRLDLMVYSFPYTGAKDLGLDRLIVVRDSVLRANIEGNVPGSYPTTVTDHSIYFRNVFMPSGERRSEVRGIWNMAGGAMMAGPFVQQAIHDEANGRVIVAEGFVYNPNDKKRDLIRLMEGSLYTFRPNKQESCNPKQLFKVRYSKLF